MIDLVGYRRWGHNEGEEPAYTQPRMYEVIRAHPTAREVWATELEQQGIVTRDEAQAVVTAEVMQNADGGPDPADRQRLVERPADAGKLSRGRQAVPDEVFPPKS